jgi:hypothetical protein
LSRFRSFVARLAPPAGTVALFPQVDGHISSPTIVLVRRWVATFGQLAVDCF